MKKLREMTNDQLVDEYVIPAIMAVATVLMVGAIFGFSYFVYKLYGVAAAGSPWWGDVILAVMFFLVWVAGSIFGSLLLYGSVVALGSLAYNLGAVIKRVAIVGYFTACKLCYKAHEEAMQT